MLARLIYVAQVQFRARHVYEAGKVFLSECHMAWQAQTNLDSIQDYVAGRAHMRGAQMLVELSRLPCHLQLLPELGFAAISGMSNLPAELCREDCKLASDFLGLIVESMASAAWDSSWWSDLWPNCFAVLLHGDQDVKLSCLKELGKCWAFIARLEKMLFPSVPALSHECEHMLRETSRQLPETAQFYLYLEGARHQLTRELVALLDAAHFTSVSAEAHKLLFEAFTVPCSTKSYTEDVFRDMRRELGQVPVSKVSSWTRQKSAIDSLSARSSDKVLPFMAKPRDASVAAFAKMKNKSLVTNALFTVPSHTKKAKAAAEQGRDYDVGLPTKEMWPLIDLEPLLPGKNPYRDERPKDKSWPDTASIFMLPTSKKASYASAAAFASVCLLSSTTPHVPFKELEQRLGSAWQVALLQKGHIFYIHGCYYLSLGWHGYAALLWAVNTFQLPCGARCFSMLEPFQQCDCVFFGLG